MIISPETVKNEVQNRNIVTIEDHKEVIYKSVEPVCLWPCVRLCEFLCSHFWMDFPQNWHRR